MTWCSSTHSSACSVEMLLDFLRQRQTPPCRPTSCSPRCAPSTLTPAQGGAGGDEVNVIFSHMMSPPCCCWRRELQVGTSAGPSGSPRLGLGPETQVWDVPQRQALVPAGLSQLATHASATERVRYRPGAFSTRSLCRMRKPETAKHLVKSSGPR